MALAVENFMLNSLEASLIVHLRESTFFINVKRVLIGMLEYFFCS